MYLPGSLTVSHQPQHGAERSRRRPPLGTVLQVGDMVSGLDDGGDPKDETIDRCFSERSTFRRSRSVSEARDGQPCAVSPTSKVQIRMSDNGAAAPTNVDRS
jgi:hypothetical protein